MAQKDTQNSPNLKFILEFSVKSRKSSSIPVSMTSKSSAQGFRASEKTIAYTRK
jgi:hypothetical protein